MKKISLVKIPFHITLVSIFLPMIAAYFFIELHRFILLITVFLFSIIFLYRKKMIFSRSNIFFLFLLLIFMVYDQIVGRGLFYFSHSHFIIYIFVFYHCFLFDENRFNEKLIIRQVSKIYSIIMFFMLVELFIQLSGNVNMLFAAFPDRNIEAGTVINIYRDYNNRFSASIGLPLSALNSIILGNQIASQLSLNAMLWFFPFYFLVKLPKIFKKSNLWFFIALILFIISPTMTANVLFIISFILLVFYIPISRLNNIKGKIIFAVISFIISGVLIKFLFPLFYSGQRLYMLGSNWDPFEFYVYGMIYPIFYFLDMPFYDQLFGQVDQPWAELGYFKLLISLGALWVFSMTIALFVIIINAFRLNINLKEETPSSNNGLQYNWIWLAQVNAFISLMYFLSLIHYITILRLGVIQLFSLHIAIAMFATRKAKMLRNYSADVNINVHKVLTA